MEIFIIVFVVIGALISIASGIWVAIALGSAISKDGKKKISTGTKDS
jgi:energy-converting hydrogenase Eha subunit A